VGDGSNYKNVDIMTHHFRH